MTAKTSKDKQELAYFLDRIDQIRMSEWERVNAKARFERADAVAAVLASVARAVARLFASLTAGSGQPPHRPASSAR